MAPRGKYKICVEEWQNYLVNPEAAKQFECTICLKIFCNPEQIGCEEGHVYCRSCISQLRQPGTHTIRCPLCREECDVSKIAPVPFVARQINNLQCKCKNHKICKDKLTEICKKSNAESDNTNNKKESVPLRRSARIKKKNEEQNANANKIGQKRKLNNSDEPMLRKKRKLNNKKSEESKEAIESCDWIGPMSEFHRHYYGCPFGFIFCGFCPNRILRKDKAKHHESCLCAPIECKKCKRKYIARDKMKLHIENDCPMTIVVCDKCNKETERRRYEKHKTKKCPEIILNCTYEKFGCNDKHKRKDMDNHHKNNTMYHLRIVTDSHNKLERKLNRLEQRIDRLESANDSDDSSESSE